MARSRATGCCMFIGMLLATALLPESLWAGPFGERVGDGEGDVTQASRETVPGSPVRSKRNAGPPDFWTWYKFFVDTGNQDGVQNLDRVYVAHLQNKHRVDEGRSFGHYLSHLKAVYKACAESDDPGCISELTSKPTAQLVMPGVAPAVAYNPYDDSYYRPDKASPRVPVVTPDPLVSPGPPAPPAPVKSPLPGLSPALPMSSKGPSGYYHAPVLQPFLSAQQQEDLLRICNPSDVECLQYHLRANYGLMPAIAPAPSYAQLGCDPARDPYCMPAREQKAPSALYHQYPTCDPDYDPYCVPSVSAPAAQFAGKSRNDPEQQSCNPLFDKYCSPLTATKLASVTMPVLQPYGAPAYLSRLVQAKERPRQWLGIRGKTKEGYDCYMFYDTDCYPLGTPVSTQAEVPAGYTGKTSQSRPDCHPYDPTCTKFSPPQSFSSARNLKGDLVEPDPNCDPEYDYSCRLRRHERQSGPAPKEQKDEPVHHKEPQREAQTQGSHGDPHLGYGAQEHAAPSFDAFLKGHRQRNGRDHSP